MGGGSWNRAYRKKEEGGGGGGRRREVKVVGSGKEKWVGVR